MTSLRFFVSRIMFVSSAVAALTGCRSVNNDQVFDTQLARVTHAGTAAGPLGYTPLTASFQHDINSQNEPSPSGNSAALQVTTDASGSYQYKNMREPANWTISYSPNSPTGHCYDYKTQASLTNPITLHQDLYPNTAGYGFDYDYSELDFSLPDAPAPVLDLPCFTNTAANPDFLPNAVSPQFSLDDARPAIVTVAALRKLVEPPSETHLTLISMAYRNAADVIASSIAPDGMSATFPYPSAVAGPYLGMITSHPASQPVTTDGMEPIYIAHEDKSFASAFGVAVATPSEVDTVSTTPDPNNDGSCAGEQVITQSPTLGGTAVPLVTLLRSGQLAVGSSSATKTVGTSPTVVIAFNDEPQYYQSPTSWGAGQCEYETQTWTGAQSALVVNTGSASISVLQIGTYPYPSGTVYVGHHPVAAVVTPTSYSTPFAYVANYDDGTISEVNLSSLQQTRVLHVMQHPTSLAWGANGVLWVGGQGSLQQVNINNWSAGTLIAVDGTITGMSYDAGQGALVFGILQNGTPSSPSNGRTMANSISYSAPTATSYTASGVITISSGRTSGATVMTDTSAYEASPMKSYLAFPAQTAFSPPVITATGGDIIATATGNAFTVSVISSGVTLITGSTPYPIRGVALSDNMLYFTMSESNSLVSLPILYQ